MKLRILALAGPAWLAGCFSLDIEIPPTPYDFDLEVRQLATGMEFVEGPVWLEGEQAVVFSDIPRGQLMRWSKADGLTELRPSENSNGNALDVDGALLSCQHGARNIVRQAGDGPPVVLVDRFEGKRFNSPNDLAVQRDGVLWFTDPPWGLPRQTEGKELEGHWVFRFDPGTGDLRAVLTDRCMPNGIALSPDESRLYVSDTGGHPSHPDPVLRDLPATVSAYALEGGELVSTEPVWRVETLSDGMCVQADGWIWATGEELTVWTPDGEHMATVSVPEKPTNVCLGGPDGRTLFITAQTSLYAVDLSRGLFYAAMDHYRNKTMTAHLTTATPGLEISEAHFQKLGFTKVSDEPVLYAAGGAVIEIDPDRFTRPGVKLWRSSWKDKLETLAEFGALHDLEGGRVIAAPSGTWIYLMDGVFEAPAGAATAEPSVLGNFAGLSLETTRMEDSQRFWELLGFKTSGGGADQGWLSLTNESGFGLSIMKPFSCPHMFVTPSMTYFNSGKNPEIIAEIRRREIPIAEEVTVFNPKGEVDNVILREPGGYGFFVFND